MSQTNNPFSNEYGIRNAIRLAQEQLRPPPDIKPSEWAEKSVYIPIGNAVPGQYRVANAPIQRGPIDMLVDADCYRMTLMWGAQTGKTLVALICQTYSIEVQPKSQMMMQPSQGDLQTWLETKFNPVIDANPTLGRLIAKPRGREGVNNQRMKSYPGGFMMFAWSGSPKTMRGRSAPLIVCDETEGYEKTPEGHAVGLLWQRAATFGDQRKLIEISTPVEKETSYIEPAYLAGDQRQFYVCCPHCDEKQTLVWENVTWIGRQSTGIDDAEKDTDQDHQLETARYACAHCGVLWDDGQRIAEIRQAEEKGAGWIAAKPFKGHASFHANELYSTFRRLRDIVQSYLDKLATDDLQTFVNVSLSLTWEEKGEKADPKGLLARREEYAAPVPAGAVYITAGIDMQQDRLEVEIVGWGIGEESWSIDYRVLWGDTLQDDVWDDLDGVLEETFLHECGVYLPISAAALDTGGTAGHTQRAYDYAKGKTGRRLFAIKGQGGWGIPVVQAPQRKQSGKKARKVDLFRVGVDEVKLITMRRLGRQLPGPGYCHFPNEDLYGEEYFKQLTAEKLLTKYVKGQPVREWTKPDKARNEALDCRNYAFAALKITNPNLKRLTERYRVGDEAPQTPAQLEESVKRVKRVATKPKETEKPQEDEAGANRQSAPVRKGRRVLKSTSKGAWSAKKW